MYACQRMAGMLLTSLTSTSTTGNCESKGLVDEVFHFLHPFEVALDLNRRLFALCSAFKPSHTPNRPDHPLVLE
ncbi:hypothetical protein SCHPADRAFT_286947 [Schizopora paradoxa]|uniref:Uncharacterized protein n=1 Tax=Schizopora paradoxa TaxID=27342 RepID=A0A0H2RZR0_9AGAM|nr:hypothetical protein SCHPADRAFT_286947 [Schizopora paradoxa]